MDSQRIETDTAAATSETNRGGSENGVADAGAAAATAAPEMRAADLQFILAASALYHRSRVAWFATLHRAGLFATLLASTGAVAAFTHGNTALARWVSLLAAAVSAAGLAFDFAGGARKHDECRKAYHDIMADLTSGAVTPEVCQARIIKQAASDPAVFEAASRIAYNQALRSLGRDEAHCFVLRRRQEWLRHVWPFTGAHFAQRKDMS